MKLFTSTTSGLVAVAMLELAGCGGSSSSSSSTSSASSSSTSSASSSSNSLSSSAATYTIGGSISGLTGTGLVLQNNAGNDLTASADGSFTFTTSIASGAAYAVTIKTQSTATPAETCVVTNGSGSVASANINNVSVTCHVLVAKFLYVPNNASPNSSVDAYSINAATGALTAIAGSPFPAGGANMSFAVADPSGKYLYITARGSATAMPELIGYSINQATGVLTDLAASPFDFTTPPLPAGLTSISPPQFHPSGQFGYVFHGTANRIYGATLNSLTGDLTDIAGTPYTLTFPTGGPFNAAGTIFYVAGGPPIPGVIGTVTTYSVGAGGMLTVQGSVSTGGAVPNGGRLHPNGKFLFVPNAQSANVAVLEVNATTGLLTAVAGSPFSTGGAGSVPVFLQVHVSGNFLYVINQGSSPGVAVFAINTTTGVLTPVAGSPFSTNGTGVINGGPTPDGKFFHVLNRGTNTIEAYVINQTTGVLTEVSGAPYATGNSPFSLSPDPSGKYLYVANTVSNTVSSYAINSSTGGLTLVTTLPTGTGPQGVSPIGRQ